MVLSVEPALTAVSFVSRRGGRSTLLFAPSLASHRGKGGGRVKAGGTAGAAESGAGGGTDNSGSGGNRGGFTKGGGGGGLNR